MFFNCTKHSPIKSSLTRSLSQTLKRNTVPSLCKTVNGRRCLKTNTQDFYRYDLAKKQNFYHSNNVLYTGSNVRFCTAV
jgi:hypothetical protein